MRIYKLETHAKEEEYRLEDYSIQVVTHKTNKTPQGICHTSNDKFYWWEELRELTCQKI